MTEQAQVVSKPLNPLNIPQMDICPSCGRKIRVSFDKYAHGYVYAYHSKNGSARGEDECEKSLNPYVATLGQ